MTSLQDALAQKTGMGAILEDGLETLSVNDSIVFTQYNRAVLPLDGLVFWIATTTTRTIECAIQYGVQVVQNESETQGISMVQITTEEQIDDLLIEAPTTKWIALWNGMHLGFTKVQGLFKPAEIYHYIGQALNSIQETQVIDTPGATLDPTKLIASNSLPAFLLFNTYTPPYDCPYVPANLPVLYPSKLAPQNLTPPYATVHIEPSRTEAFQQVPWYESRWNPYAETVDEVVITMYGLTNNQAALLRDAILQASRDMGVIGIVEMGAIRDEKAQQEDFTILAQKKTLRMRVSYYQQAIIDHARQVFETLQVTYTPSTITA